MSFLKKRGLTSYKGENGRVLVIGGSKDYVGAPGLVGMAALRTGVDLVTIAAPEKAAWVINSYSPDLIVAEACVVRLSNVVIDLVEEAFLGTKVGTSEVSSHVDDNHIAVVNHPMTREFEEFRKKFDETYCFKGDRLEVDFSEGAPEMEFTDRLRAKEDCYKMAKFCNWVVKTNNLEKIMKLVES